MAKPILVIRFPLFWTSSQVYEARKALHTMEDMNLEYHVLVLQDSQIDNSPKFEIYNSPHRPEEVEEITELVRKSFNRCLQEELDRNEDDQLNIERGMT